MQTLEKQMAEALEEHTAEAVAVPTVSGNGGNTTSGPGSIADFDIRQLSRQTSLMREILGPGPRNLVNIVAELFFVEGGQFVFHWRKGPAVWANTNGVPDGWGWQGEERFGPQEEHFKFLSPDQIRAAFNHVPVDSGFFPPNIVRWGTGKRGNWIVQFVPPSFHEMTLDEGSGQFRTLCVPLPGLIFAGIGTDYFIWATRASAFQELSPATPLYNAPLPNVDSLGKICYGANTPPAAGVASLSTAWQLFIQSAPFNSHHANLKSKGCAEDVRLLLRALDQTHIRGIEDWGTEQVEKHEREQRGVRLLMALAGNEDTSFIDEGRYPANDLVAITARVANHAAPSHVHLSQLIEHFLVNAH